MKSRWLNVTHRGAFLAFLGLSLLGLGSTWADEADPPGRVARLSDLQGSVSLQPAGVQDWAAATLNRPLTTGDRLWADQDARAERDMGDAAPRLGATTGFSFLNLDDHTAPAQPRHGRSRHQRTLGGDARLRLRVGAECGGGGVGAVPIWTVGMDRPLGLDVGG